MTVVRSVRAAEPVGREPELLTLQQFLSTEGSRGLVLTGGPGIGKTTLWEAAVAAARERGIRALSTRASGAEARLAFAGLIDLLDGVGPEELEPLPAPQRRALEVALLRVDPAGQGADSHAVALGFLNTLRALSERCPLLIAVDDVQWLDRPSAEVIAFAVRRLEHEPVLLLLAKRQSPPADVEQALAPGRLQHVEVGPLSLGAVRQLLLDRLGLSLPRHLLRRLVDSTLGNPLFALEVGRVLALRGLPAAGEQLPVPDAVEDALGSRVASLSADQRRLLLAISLSAELNASELAAIADPAAVEGAVSDGLLVVDGGRVRASHPLLAAAASARASESERCRLHGELAAIAGDPELRARHLALSVREPDEELAAGVAAAAEGAFLRGARREAAELGEHALRLTPSDSTERPERLLALASYLETAGERDRVRELLTANLDSIPNGPPRARAWLLLADAVYVHLDEYRRYLDRAYVEARADLALHARVVAKMSTAWNSVERIAGAETPLLDVLPAARRAGPDVERAVLYSLTWARALRGRSVDDVCERWNAVSGPPGHLAESPERVAGQRLVWRGQLAEARSTFERLLALSDERGEVDSYVWARLHLCELALRAGDWDTAERLLDEWAATPERDLFVEHLYARCRGLLAVGRGQPDEAARWAGEAIARSQAMGHHWDWLEGLRALGTSALLEREPARAVESLAAVWEHLEREGVEEPGVFPVAPDLVEASVELGELQRARLVTARLRELSSGQAHPWGLVTSERCEGLIGLAVAFGDRASAALGEAARSYDAIGLRFDSARTLLALGRALRRHRKWGAAREALERAAAAFDELGSSGWADEARSELGRVGARRPAGEGRLTPAERRVAELAAEGLANKQIAGALFVSVKTVEGHLSHVYAKLGVRSRAQLARRLSMPG